MMGYLGEQEKKYQYKQITKTAYDTRYSNEALAKKVRFWDFSSVND